MEALLPLAEKIGAQLKQRNETIGIAKSSTGGLISAALLWIGGASAYFRGGGDLIPYLRVTRIWIYRIHCPRRSSEHPPSPMHYCSPTPFAPGWTRTGDWAKPARPVRPETGTARLATPVSR